MAKFLTIAVICSLLFVSFQALRLDEYNVSVVTVDDWDDYLRAHPEYEAITPLNGNLTAFSYKFGKRDDGDGLVGNKTIDKKWNSPQDTIFATMYPGGGGAGAVVTHVQVDVKQVCGLYFSPGIYI